MESRLSPMQRHRNMQDSCATHRIRTPEQLLKEFSKIRNELLAERAAMRRDLEDLLEFLATQKKLTRVESSARSLGRGETAEARAILAAQSRFEAHGSRHAELKGAR